MKALAKALPLLLAATALDASSFSYVFFGKNDGAAGHSSTNYAVQHGLGGAAHVQTDNVVYDQIAHGNLALGHGLLGVPPVHGLIGNIGYSPNLLDLVHASHAAAAHAYQLDLLSLQHLSLASAAAVAHPAILGGLGPGTLGGPGPGIVAGGPFVRPGAGGPGGLGIPSVPYNPIGAALLSQQNGFHPDYLAGQDAILPLSPNPLFGQAIGASGLQNGGLGLAGIGQQPAVQAPIKDSLPRGILRTFTGTPVYVKTHRKAPPVYEDSHQPH